MSEKSEKPALGRDVLGHRANAVKGLISREAKPEVLTNVLPESGTSAIRSATQEGELSPDLSRPASSHVPDAVAQTAAPIPKYLTLARKDARLTFEQLEFLTTLKREINRKRHNREDKITENTLIRAAVELLQILDFDRSGIEDETDLISRVKRAPKRF